MAKLVIEGWPAAMQAIAPPRSTGRSRLYEETPIRRVELHPAIDRWMRGDRHGMPSTTPHDRLGVRSYRARMKRSGKLMRVTEDNIGKWL